VGFHISPWYVPRNLIVGGAVSPSTIHLLVLIKGTFALCSAQLGKELVLPFFNVIATIVTVCVLLLWVLVAVLTVIEVCKGRMFYAPCLTPADRIPEDPVPDVAVGNGFALEDVNGQASDK
jgi:membrane protein implicated in regulation of membrane protease activity